MPPRSPSLILNLGEKVWEVTSQKVTYQKTLGFLCKLVLFFSQKLVLHVKEYWSGYEKLNNVVLKEHVLGDLLQGGR